MRMFLAAVLTLTAGRAYVAADDGLADIPVVDRSGPVDGIELEDPPAEAPPEEDFAFAEAPTCREDAGAAFREALEKLHKARDEHRDAQRSKEEACGEKTACLVEAACRSQCDQEDLRYRRSS